MNIYKSDRAYNQSVCWAGIPLCLGLLKGKLGQWLSVDEMGDEYLQLCGKSSALINKERPNWVSDISYTFG